MKNALPYVPIPLLAALGYWLGAGLPQEASTPGFVLAILGTIAGVFLALGRRATFDRLATVELEINFLGQKVRLKVDDAVRRAAWALFVEYRSRITTRSLTAHEGILREALTSLYQLFEKTRVLLREAGPSAALRPSAGPASAPVGRSLGDCALEMLNERIRPILAYYHPLLQAHEDRRPVEVARKAWEDEWPLAEELRSRLGALSADLVPFIDELGRIAQAD